MTELRQRLPRVESPGFLNYVRGFPCCCCGARAPSQAAHIRIASETYGKRQTGMGEKPDDRWAVPLCQACHLDDNGSQHRIGERAFWFATGIDPFALATGLWNDFNRLETRRKI